MKSIKYKVIPLQGLTLEGEAHRIEICDKGQSRVILRDHAPMISLIQNGKVMFFLDEKKKEEVTCSEGMLHIRQNSCVVTVVK